MENPAFDFSEIGEVNDRPTSDESNNDTDAFGDPTLDFSDTDGGWSTTGHFLGSDDTSGSSTSGKNDSETTSDSETTGDFSGGETGTFTDSTTTGTNTGTDTETDIGDTTTTTGFDTTSTTTSDVDTGEGTSDTDATKSDALAYCEKGALSCYTFDRISNHQITDRGLFNAPLNLDSGAFLGSLDTQFSFLKNTLVMRESTQILRDPQAWQFVSEVVGFDVWFTVNNTNQDRFSLIRIGQYLQMSYDGSGNLECSAKNGGTWVTASVSLGLRLNAAHHVACSYDGEKLIVGALGKENSQMVSLDPEIGALVWIGRNPPDESSDSFEGELAAMRIWNDVDRMYQAMAEESAAIQEQSF